MLCGRDPVRTQALATEFGIAEITLDAGELCARPDIDAVTICTPNHMHGRHAMIALAHGKHVFCEKPLALTVDEAATMVDAANRQTVVHQVGFTFRHLFGVEELQRRVQDGEIGEPLVLRLHHQYFDGVQGGPDIRWHHTLDAAGGGVLRDTGSHLFDLARFILGPIAAVRAELTFSGRPGVQTDDVATVGLWYDSGASGECFASRVTPAHHPNFVEVVGSKGALHALLSRGGYDRLKRLAQSEWQEVELPAEAGGGGFHALQRMMHSFVEGCLRGAPSKGAATFEDGLATQQMISAAEEAALSHGWVKLRRRARVPSLGVA